MELKVTIIQMGARLHYAVPAALEEAGILQFVYTDAHSLCGPLRVLKCLPNRLMPSVVRRLLSRNVPQTIVPEKIRSWIRPSVQIEWVNRLRPGRRKMARYWYKLGLGGHWLAKRAVADDFGGANTLYVHPCVSTEAVREAKKRGIFVVLEAISHPRNKFVEKAEFEQFGHPFSETDDELEDNIAFFSDEAKLANVVLAASPYVRQGLIELGIEESRISLVPYGLDSCLFQGEASPEPGRVLFVGKVGYLKGVHYLAEATRILKADGFAGQVRAVGPYDGALIERLEFQGPNYIGQVPRGEIATEFRSADVFVFPTLSDGFGIVLLEAMAAGLPVICTPNCADLVEDGVNGYIVAQKDGAALADRINAIVSNRVLRDRMSRAAIETAELHDMESYRNRMCSVLFSAQSTES